MTIGLEMEFWVVDEYGHLCDGHDLTEVHDDALPEFVESLIEVRTPPESSVANIGDSLRNVLERLLKEAAATDRWLVPLGTPLTENPSDIPRSEGRSSNRFTETAWRSQKLRGYSRSLRERERSPAVEPLDGARPGAGPHLFVTLL